MLRNNYDRIALLKISVLFLWLFFFVFFVQAHAETRSSRDPSVQKRVVLLNSYHKGFLWTDEITRGVEETLAKSGVDLHVEYMDTKRQFDTTYQNLLSDLLSLKYGRHLYDLVITSDNNAFNFFRERGKQIFVNTPHVFCGVNYLNRRDLKGITNTTGVNERADIVGNLSLIRRLHPDCRKVVVITDDTTTGKRIQEEVTRLIKRYRFSSPKLELLYDVSAWELIRAVQNFPPQTVVLLTLFFRDNTGAFFEYDQGTKMVCDLAAVPVYGTWHFQLNHGIVGGHLVDGFDQGSNAALKALAILAGKNIDDIPVRYQTPTQLRFDFRQLQRHGIDLVLLPPESQILHQPVFFYDQYKKLIWITVCAFCLLLMAFLGVGFGLVRSRQAAKELRRNEENLRTTLHSIGDAVIATDAEGKIVRMNPVAEKLTGWRMDDAQGKPLNAVFRIVHAKTNEPAGNPVEKVLAFGEIVSLANHTKLISKNGTEYHIADSGAPIRDVDGNITGVVLVFQDVTKEYQLREQYRNMAFLVESASTPIVMATSTGRLSHVNPAFLRTWGYDRPDEVLGRSVTEFWMIGERMTEILNNIETEGLESEEVRAQRRDGSFFDVQVSAVAVRDDTGRPLALMASSFDITERKQAEAARNESEARYRNLFESAGDAILLMSGETFIDCNHKTLEIYGCTREQILGRSPVEFTPPFQPDGRNSVEKAKEKINSALVGNPQLFEWQHKKMNGTLFETEVSLNLVELSTGTYIQAIVRDITERKGAEEALRRSEAKFRGLVESSFDWIWEVNEEGVYTYASPQIESILGYKPEEILGRKLFERMTAEESERIAVVFHNLQEKQKPVVAMEKVNLHKDGRRIVLETSGVPVFDETTGKLTGYRGIDRDITERKELEDQLRHSQKMDAIGVLAGGVAHDFNNMLAGIMGAAEIIKGNSKLNEEDTSYIDMIILSSTRAADLTSKLLAFSRKGKLLSSSVDVHSIIKDSVRLLEGSIDKKIRINRVIKAENYLVIGDNSQLQNLLMNLCINASQAMPDGGEITISTRNLILDKIYCQASPFDLSPGEFMEIEVRDTGYGIPHENLQKIFEPFFTTKDQGKGTGLGLSAVYGIVKKHHGAISVYSEPDTGTVFHILLPGSEEKADPIAGNESIKKGTGLVLLVDDEAFIRITAKSMLESMGYEVLLAENGKAGVDLFEKEYKKIDLVLLDMVMPVMNGQEAYEKMKQIDGDVKVIISSGFSKPDDINELRKSGLAGFIRKPYFKVELSQLVADVLSGKD
jgi:PAS domain S-box-containing protein